MRTVTVYREFLHSDLLFVTRCSTLAALFVPDEPNLWFELEDSDGYQAPENLLNRSYFVQELTQMN